MRKSDKAAKTCPMCQASIPAAAKKCSHCGSDLRPWIERHILLTCIGLALGLMLLWSMLGALIGISTSQTKSSKPLQPEMQVTAEDLMTEYERNEIAADARYKGKVLEIRGEVEGVGNDFLNNPYVTLKSDNAVWGVQCMLKSSQTERAATLAEGSSITVVGRVSGKLLNVIVRECRIL